MTTKDSAEHPSAWTADGVEEMLRRRAETGDVVVGDRCLYRPGQLVLSDRAVGLLEEELRALSGSVMDGHAWLDEIGLTLWRVDTSAEETLVATAARLQAVALARAEEPNRGRDVGDAAGNGRGEPGGDLGVLSEPITVSVNHVFLGQPHPQGGPAGPPSTTRATRQLESGPDGDDADIAVLDTGVPTAAQLLHWHGHLEETVRRDAGNPLFPDDLDTLYDAGHVLRHEAGHGTFIAGLVHLVAPDLLISPYAVLDPDGIGDDLGIAHAVRTVTSRPRSVPVINLSLGGYTFDDAPPAVLATVIDRMPRGTVVVAAAGNNGSPRPFWPAAMARVVGVAAVDDVGSVPRPTQWSNYGPWVDVCTLGAGLLSTYVLGPYPTGPSTSQDFTGPHPFARWSGTSFAAPLVAAEIARRVLEDAEMGAAPTGPLTADGAWRDLQSELVRLPSGRPVGLLYWPPVDPRAPRAQ